MLPLTPTAPTAHGTTSSVARGQTELIHPRFAWGPRIPLPRGLRLRRFGARALALGLAAVVASGGAMPPSAAAQRAAAPAAYSVAAQLPTPTPTPTPEPVTIVPIEFGETVTITGNPTPFSVDPSQAVQPGPAITLGSAGTGITRGDCVSPDFIFQGCPLGRSDAERRLEDRAIALVLQQYGLPESERPRVLRYARDEVRAALYVDLMEAFQTMREERSPDQQLLVDVYAPLVREIHVQAMRAAQDEYRRWNLDPCGYEAPSGFTYDARGACIGASRGFRPESPGLQAFVAYGFKRVLEDGVVNDPRAPAVFVATSSGMIQLYGLAATGYAAAIGSQIAIPTAVLKAVAPFSLRAALDVSAAAADTATSTTTAATSGATSMAGLLAILVASISTAITGTMSIAREAELPGQLQGLVDAAPNFDVEWIMRTCLGATGCVTAYSTDARSIVDQEMFTAVVLSTLPDYPGTDPVPAAQPGEPRLVVDGRPVDWLKYKADDDDASPRAVRLGSGPWFVDRPDSAGDGDARLTLQIKYQDASKATWSARRAGNGFIIVRTELPPTNINYPAPRQSPDLSVVDPSDQTVTARVGE
jgi:hypothetical protein